MPISAIVSGSGVCVTEMLSIWKYAGSCWNVNVSDVEAAAALTKKEKCVYPNAPASENDDRIEPKSAANEFGVPPSFARSNDTR